jgi:hypothetical protein
MVDYIAARRATGRALNFKSQKPAHQGNPSEEGSSLMADWLLLEPKPLMFPPRRTEVVSQGLCQISRITFKGLIIKSLKYFATGENRTI